MRVQVSAPSRLHLGILSDGHMPRPWQGMGLAIKEPRTTLYAETSDMVGLRLVGDFSEDIATALSSFYSDMKMNLGVVIELFEHPPRHVGLGSGTQIILSAATAMSRLAGVELAIDEIALRTNRGKYSWIGVEAFNAGGFIVSLGRGRNQQKQPALRLNFPEDWPIVILIPDSREGLSGQEEEHALWQVRYSDQTTMNIHTCLVNEVIPGILEHDIELFGKGVESIQRMVGSEFSSIQGGTYNRASEILVELMRSEGLLGVGQSSWGPAVYGFTERCEDAIRVISKAKDLSPGIKAYLTAADNQGARVIYS
jgi:beta-ribofuranosylaminobenzene 5'-phosphate synthase